MSLLALQLDRRTAGHLAVAIAKHRELLEDNGHPCPTALADLQHIAIEVGKGHEGTPRADSGPAIQPPTYGRGNELLSHKQAAEILNVDRKTVGRWITRGDLPGVGPRRQVPRHALERFARGRSQ